MSSIELETIVFPTEDISRVLKAMINILPESALERENWNGSIKLVARSDDINALERLREMLATQRIRSAARSLLLSGIRGQGIQIELNKQAAYANRISFADPEDNPLGTLTLRIKGPRPEQIVEWLTGI